MVSVFLRVLKLVDACLDIKVQIKNPQIITERPGVVAPLPQGHAHILLPPLIAKCHKNAFVVCLRLISAPKDPWAHSSADSLCVLYVTGGFFIPKTRLFIFFNFSFSKGRAITRGKYINSRQLIRNCGAWQCETKWPKLTAQIITRV